MKIIHDPKNTIRIESLWAILSVDEIDGLEGVIAVNGPNNTMFPLIAADPERLESIKELARQNKKFTKKKMKLVRFTTRIDLEEL